MKIIIGAGETNYEGWIKTQESELDLLSSSSWDKLFPVESIDAKKRSN